MEFVDGTDLRRVLQAGELSPEEALSIVPQICEALQFAHDEGIVHRDIKPENILLDKKGRVKIADFGLAKLLGRPAAPYTLTADGHRMGTPHYMAPEQIEHPGQVDHRADIYSLGVVFYEMLTGELPLGRFAPPSKKVHVDIKLDEVVLRTLEKEPERRYQQASEVKTDVETIKAESRPPKAPIAPAGQPHTPAPAINRMEKHITIVAVISIVFGTMGALLGTFLFVAIGGINFISIELSPKPAPMKVAAIAATAIGGFFVLMSVPEIVAGIGLLKRRSWARILAFALAILNLMKIPVGTAIGIYAIWVLFNEETIKLFAQASEIRRKEQAAGIKPGPKKIVLHIISITAAVLFLIAISVAVLHGALPWFAFVPGLLLLILVIFALRRAKGKAATGVAGQVGTTQTKIDRRAVLIGLVVAVIALILTVITMLPLILPALYMARASVVRLAPTSTVVAPGVQKINGWFFPNGSPDDLTFGPEGPTLNDICILKLNLKPPEVMEVNRILQTAYKKYPELEAQYTEQLRSGNSLKVTISPFRQEAERFLEDLWSDVDSKLDAEQHVLAREHLPLGQLFGMISVNNFGQAKVIIMISKENGSFSYSTTIQWDNRRQESRSSGKTLPVELQRFWSQPATNE
jgi:hypothetical protein